MYIYSLILCHFGTNPSQVSLERTVYLLDLLRTIIPCFGLLLEVRLVMLSFPMQTMHARDSTICTNHTEHQLFTLNCTAFCNAAVLAWYWPLLVRLGVSLFKRTSVASFDPSVALRWRTETTSLPGFWVSNASTSIDASSKMPCHEKLIRDICGEQLRCNLASAVPYRPGFFA